MGSNLGRMLAITLPLAGIGIAAPFLAPALMGGAAAGAGAGAGVGAGAGAGAGAGTALASATPSIAATVPAVTPAAAPAAAGGGAAAAGGITPAMAAQGVQAGTSLASGMLNQQFNQPSQMPQIPTIRAPAQSVVPFGGAATDFTTPGMGLALQPPGVGPSPDAGPGSAMAMNTAQNLFPNAFNNPDPFAAYSLAA